MDRLYSDSLHIFCWCRAGFLCQVWKERWAEGWLLKDERLLINHDCLSLSLSLCMSYCLIMETHSFSVLFWFIHAGLSILLSLILSLFISLVLFVYSFRLTPDSSSHCSFSLWSFFIPPFILPGNGQSTHLNLHFFFTLLSCDLSLFPSTQCLQNWTMGEKDCQTVFLICLFLIHPLLVFLILTAPVNRKHYLADSSEIWEHYLWKISSKQ